MRKIIVSLAVCSVLVSNVYAAPVTFVFDGVVNNVEPQLTGTFSVGDAYRVQFTFESTTPDVTLDIRFGHYNSAITALSVTVGSYSATATGGDIAVTNDSAFDNYRIDVRNNSMAGPPVNGYSLFGNQNPVMVMTDFTASAFSSDALPLTQPDPANFAPTGFTLLFGNGSDNEKVSGTIDSIGTMSTFDCTGFGPPFNKELYFKNKVKRAIPVNMVLTDTNGNPVTDLDITAFPVINVLFNGRVFGEVPPNTDDLLPIGSANDDNIFRYDWGTQQWVYILGTKQFAAAGRYSVMVASGDVSEYTISSVNGVCEEDFHRLP